MWFTCGSEIHHFSTKIYMFDIYSVNQRSQWPMIYPFLRILNGYVSLPEGHQHVDSTMDEKSLDHQTCGEQFSYQQWMGYHGIWRFEQETTMGLGQNLKFWSKGNGQFRLPSGKLTVRYWKWPWIADLPIKNDDFPILTFVLPEGNHPTLLQNSFRFWPHGHLQVRS